MAHEIHYDIMPVYSDFHPVMLALHTFLQANGWAVEYVDDISSTNFRYAYTKNGIGITFYAYAAGRLYFYTGLGWDGVSLTPNYNFSNYAEGGGVHNHPIDFRYTSAYYNNPWVFISHGDNLYIICPNANDATAYTSIILGIGRLDKFGIYDDGIFRIQTRRYWPLGANQSTTYAGRGVMVGTRGRNGTSPHLWLAEYNQHTKNNYSVNVDQTVGYTNQSTLVTPFQPVVWHGKDQDLDIWIPLGSLPGALLCHTIDTHKVMDIIDHQGSQWICVNEATNNYEVNNIFRLD